MISHTKPLINIFITLYYLLDIGLTENNTICKNHMIFWKLKAMHRILHKLMTKANAFLIITITTMNHNSSPPSISIILTIEPNDAYDLFA